MKRLSSKGHEMLTPLLEPRRGSAALDMATVDPVVVSRRPSTAEDDGVPVTTVRSGRLLVLDWIGVVSVALPLFVLSYSSCVSYAQLIVTGSKLHTDVVAAMHLFSSGVSGILLPLVSRCPLIVPSADITVTIFYQTIVRDIVVQARQEGIISPEEAAATAQLALPLNTVLMGLVLWFIGESKQTVAISYLPYPVVAGFLGTIGWAILCGSFAVLADGQVSVPMGLPHLAKEYPSQLTCALCMAFSSVLLRGRRISPTVLAIAPMICAMVGFWLWVLATGQDVDELRSTNWLFPASSSVPFWKIWTAQDLSAVYWPLLAPRLSTFGGLGMVLILSLVLRIAGIEGSSDVALDLDAEVKWTGLGSLATGLFGTVIGSHSPGLTTFNMQCGRKDVRVSIVTAALTLVVWFSGLPAMEILPRFMLAGILMNLGLVMLLEWMWKARVKVGWNGLMIIYSQVITSAVAGLLPSVLMGVVAACVMGQASLMRLHVLRYHVSGQSIQSYVARTIEDEQILKQHAHEIEAVGLEGILAEGPMVRFNTYLTRYVEHNPHVRFLVLDFRMCQGCNPSACAQLAKLGKKLHEKDVDVIYANVQQIMKERMLLFGVSGVETFCDSVQTAIEICEDRVLGSSRGELHDSCVTTLNLKALAASPDREVILLAGLAELLQCSHEQATKLQLIGAWQTVLVGAPVIRQDKSASRVFFAIPKYSEVRETIDIGEISGAGHMVCTSRLGAVCGGESLFHKEAARSTWTVTVDGSNFLSVPKETVETLFEEDPKLALHVSRAVNRQLLLRSDALVQAVELNKSGGWSGAHFDKFTASGTVASAKADTEKQNSVKRFRSLRTQLQRKPTLDSWADDWLARRRSPNPSKQLAPRRLSFTRQESEPE